MAKKNKSGQVSIHYEERPDKPTLTVSGAHGGITGDGQHVVAHVYAEWGMLPSLEQISIKPSGEQESKIIKRGDVNREVQATLLMTPETALNFGKWLISKGMLAYNRRTEQGPPFEIEEDDANS